MRVQAHPNINVQMDEASCIGHGHYKTFRHLSNTLTTFSHIQNHVIVCFIFCKPTSQPGISGLDTTQYSLKHETSNHHIHLLSYLITYATQQYHPMHLFTPKKDIKIEVPAIDLHTEVLEKENQVICKCTASAQVALMLFSIHYPPPPYASFSAIWRARCSALGYACVGVMLPSCERRVM